MKTSKQIITHLKSLENSKNQEGMKRFAIGNDNTLGISMPVLRTLSKDYKKLPNRHEVAMELWKSNIHEAMILASMLADPKLLTESEMDAWTHDFYSWDLCDQTCGNLFQKTDFFVSKAFEYSHADEEFVKRTGFVLMVQYGVHHKKADDYLCFKFLERIEEEAWDERNFVWKALNWLLRQIGKRNLYLYPHAMKTCEALIHQNTKSSRWIANDAKRELLDKFQHGKIPTVKFIK
jgi:3-methyladenine DNA glycosylase AlkD